MSTGFWGIKWGLGGGIKIIKIPKNLRPFTKTPHIAPDHQPKFRLWIKLLKICMNLPDGKASFLLNNSVFEISCLTKNIQNIDNFYIALINFL